MKNIENIDELIKKGMEGFNPTPPPDAWNFIEHQVQGGVSGGASSSGNQILQTIKQMSLIGKIVAVVSVPLVIGGVYLAFNSEPKMQAIPAKIEQPAYVETLSPSTELPENRASVQSEKPIEKPAKQKSIAADNRVVNSEVIHPDANFKPATANPPKADLDQPEPPKNTLTEKSAPAKPDKKVEPPVQPIKHSSNENSHPPAKPNNYTEPEFGNAFTPDGDGANDTWEVIAENLTFYHMQVFDDRGQMVFETDQYGNFWNGTHYKTGVDCESGQYSYVFDYQFDKSEKVKTKRGFVNLRR